jgi:Tfp pilus assembly protein PilW
MDRVAKRNQVKKRGQRGETVLSVLVGLGLTTALFAATLSSFFQMANSSIDRRTMAAAQDQAKTVADLIAAELRIAGAGMPLGQPNFAIGGTGLGTAPLPILLTATATQISYRINETGMNTVITADYTPSTTARTFTVLSASGFVVGDTVYISNLTAGGSQIQPGNTEGMMGVISAITGSSVTISSSYIAPTVTPLVFRAGSTVDRVTQIDLVSGTSGITRNPETGAVVLQPNSSFSLVYLDSAGATITLPLTNTTVANSLTAVRITVNVQGSRKLRSGATYTATATQTVALRNLNFSRTL